MIKKDLTINEIKNYYDKEKDDFEIIFLVCVVVNDVRPK